MSVSGEIGAAHRAGGVGMPPAGGGSSTPGGESYYSRGGAALVPTSTPAYTGTYSPMYPLSACNDPACGMLGVAGGDVPVSHPTVDAAAQRRSAEYNASVESLAVAQREVGVEVEQALLALRGRIDELLKFTQSGHSASAAETAAVAAPPYNMYPPPSTGVLHQQGVGGAASTPRRRERSRRGRQRS